MESWPTFTQQRRQSEALLPSHWAPDHAEPDRGSCGPGSRGGILRAGLWERKGARQTEKQPSEGSRPPL